MSSFFENYQCFLANHGISTFTNDQQNILNFLQQQEKTNSSSSNEEIETENEDKSPKNVMINPNLSHFSIKLSAHSNFSNLSENDLDVSPTKRNSRQGNELSKENSIKKRNSQILMNLAKGSCFSIFSPQRTKKNQDRDDDNSTLNTESDQTIKPISLKNKSSIIAAIKRNSISIGNSPKNLVPQIPIKNEYEVDSFSDDDECDLKIKGNIVSLLQINILTTNGFIFSEIIKNNRFQKKNQKISDENSLFNSHLSPNEEQLNIKEMSKKGLCKSDVISNEINEAIFKKTTLKKISSTPFFLYNPCKTPILKTHNQKVYSILNEKKNSDFFFENDNINDPRFYLGKTRSEFYQLNDQIFFEEEGQVLFPSIQKKVLYGHCMKTEENKTHYTNFEKLVEITLENEKIKIRELKSLGPKVFIKLKYENPIIIEKGIFALIKEGVGFYVLEGFRGKEILNHVTFENSNDYEIEFVSQKINNFSNSEKISMIKNNNWHVLKTVFVKKNSFQVYEEFKTIYFVYTTSNVVETNGITVGGQCGNLTPPLRSSEPSFVKNIKLKYQFSICYNNSRDFWFLVVKSPERVFNSLQNLEDPFFNFPIFNSIFERKKNDPEIVAGINNIKLNENEDLEKEMNDETLERVFYDGHSFNSLYFSISEANLTETTPHEIFIGESILKIDDNEVMIRKLRIQEAEII